MSSKRIGYYLDENIDPVVAQSLRHYGIKVTTPVESGLRSHGDRDQLVLACQRQQVMVTTDASLLRNTQNQSVHFGIVYYPQDELKSSDMIRRLIHIYEALTPEEMLGHVEILRV
ncbi:MAG: DUF5615 family PIN-like protein [Cyanobacteria bacterium P01_D01_bin.73]